jgi:mRNA deadenylase 3'-5' endonuclease subunit Ccr4
VRRHCWTTQPLLVAACRGTVDFIFYTPQEGRSVAQPVSVLLPPAPETHLSRRRCMPNATIPSDHVSLVADFLLSVAGRAADRGSKSKQLVG